jgi:hypothetical protein
MPAIPQEQEIVWKPLRGRYVAVDGVQRYLPSSQEIALNTTAQHILFHGTRGPGKTETQLMRFRKNVGIGYGSYWRGIIFDREYKNLDDLVSKSLRLFPKFNDGAKFHASTNLFKWTWPTGEELLFRAVKKKEDYNAYHGHEYPWIGWNELTKFPTPELYEKMMSVNRSSYTPEKDAPRDKRGNITMDKPIPLEVFSTTNSYGTGRLWVKRKFIDAAPAGTISNKEFEIERDLSNEKEKAIRTQVHIFGSYKENPYLDSVYIAGLFENSNEAERISWTTGSWDVIAGGAFDDIWKTSVHILPRFRVPHHWYVDRTFDWGSTHPFWCGWWVQATGEEVETLDSKGFPIGKIAPARGSLILINEWYGSVDEKGVANQAIGTNKGCKMSAKNIAKEIKRIEQVMIRQRWITKPSYSGPADNQIRNVNDSGQETIEKVMSDQGVMWESSDKSPGSRKIGLQLGRDMMENALPKHDGPGIYCTRNCQVSIQIIPTLPRDDDDPDDIDTDSEDHPWDGWRYRILKAAGRLADDVKVGFA